MQTVLLFDESFPVALVCNKSILSVLSVVMIDAFCKQPYNKQGPAGRKPSWQNKPPEPSIYFLNHPAGASVGVMTSMLLLYKSQQPGSGQNKRNTCTI